MRIHAIILAGGEGRRMGGADKALLMLSGRPLLLHVLDRIGPQVQNVAVSANGNPARLADFGLPVLPDEQPSLGPLSGLLAGLRWAYSGGADAVLAVPVDAPFLPDDLCARLAADGLPAFATSAGRDHPTCGLWPVSLATPLAAFLASGVMPRFRDFAAMHGAHPVEFPTPAAFANLNTPRDLALANGASE